MQGFSPFAGGLCSVSRRTFRSPSLSLLRRTPFQQVGTSAGGDAGFFPLRMICTPCQGSPLSTLSLDGLGGRPSIWERGFGERPLCAKVSPRGAPEPNKEATLSGRNRSPTNIRALAGQNSIPYSEVPFGEGAGGGLWAPKSPSRKKAASHVVPRPLFLLKSHKFFSNSRGFAFSRGGSCGIIGMLSFLALLSLKGAIEWISVCRSRWRRR